MIIIIKQIKITHSIVVTINMCEIIRECLNIGLHKSLHRKNITRVYIICTELPTFIDLCIN